VQELVLAPALGVRSVLDLVLESASEENSGLESMLVAGEKCRVVGMTCRALHRLSCRSFRSYVGT
jgi:hypothetical protein